MTQFSSQSPYNKPYIERGGEQSFLQPYNLQGTNLYGFMLEGDLTNLQTLCDRYLNTPAQGDVEYRAISPYVILSFDSVESINSILEPDRCKGTFGEDGEVIVWTLVAAGKQRGKVFVAERLAVFQPYLFVDSSPALVSGREVYGFPKEWGWIHMPTDLDNPQHFGLEAVAWEHFAPDAPGIRRPIIDIDIDETKDTIREKIHDLKAFGKLLLDPIFPDLNNIVVPGIELPGNILEDLCNKTLPMVFLKQFRDAIDGSQACYQAIVEADTQVTGFAGGNVLCNDYDIKIAPLASHPIAADLGLKQPEDLPADTFRPTLAFRVQFDFTLTAATQVYPCTATTHFNSQVRPCPQPQPIPPTPMKKKKIAVLGGGLGSMTTVFNLTEQPDWKEYYDITVYQLGWRLGGKGASGRNMNKMLPHEEPNYRIQEHGFHIFFGFYENAFRMMDRCYQALGDDGPIASVSDAFKPHNFIVLQEEINCQWTPWYLDYPENDLLPWEANTTGVRSLVEHIETALEFTLDLFLNPSNTRKEDDSSADNIFEVFADTIRDLIEPLFNVPEYIGDTLDKFDFSVESSFLGAVIQLLKLRPKCLDDEIKEMYQVIVCLIQQFQKRIRKRLDKAIAKDDIDTRRDLIIINLILTIIVGLIEDNALTPEGFNDLDNYDFTAWLERHGAWNETVKSALVTAMYDLLFAFPKGVNTLDNRSLGTAAALRWAIRMNMAYNGAIMWKMQGGMGDIIFAPMYEVLKRRGVKFEFFHRVDNLGLDDAVPNGVANIKMYKQVNLKDEDAGYDPLIDVKGLSCWPAHPNYDQIVDEEVALLKDNNIDLEDFWTRWPELHEEEEITLDYGKDFDLVILGIAIGSFPYICPELIEAKPQWNSMVTGIQTVTTQGGQLWLTPTLTQLGWTQPSAVVGTYVEPLDTYADMTELISKENWPAAYYPYNLAYFTGTMPDPGIPMPIADNYDFPAEQQTLVNNAAIQYLETAIGYLWPEATTKQNPQGLDWNLLVDPENRTGQDRFNSQFWRINISPSERYVMSVPMSQNVRLDPDNSGFNNLYLTGDWVNNPLNSGCVEATVMAGMKSAQTLLSKEFNLSCCQKIVGENLLGVNDSLTL